MATNYTGDSAGTAFPPVISIPDGADAPNANSVNVPLKKLADQIQGAYVKTLDQNAPAFAVLGANFANDGTVGTTGGNLRYKRTPKGDLVLRGMVKCVTATGAGAAAIATGLPMVAFNLQDGQRILVPATKSTSNLFAAPTYFPCFINATGDLVPLIACAVNDYICFDGVFIGFINTPT